MPHSAVLAIDPGYDRCGVAVVSREDGRDVLWHSSCITTDKKLPFSKRLKRVVDVVERLIEYYHPGSLSLEQLYFTNNQKTAMRVAEVRGCLIYLSGKHGVPIFEYTPPQVKAAVAGWGRADKKQLMLLLPKLITLKKPIKYDDEYDAIAIGITHLASRGTKGRVVI